MAQRSKFIDVTRTYVPIDPNAFPESMHLNAQEDASPENKIPVMAYKGYNFLPTAYGYKSYFGTKQSIAIDALAARVDFVFIYQNKAYENILIALTDSGIWIKKGEATGAWTNTVPVIPAANPATHYAWTYTTIADILYVYQQGAATYQRIEHSSTLGVNATSQTPNFLNMAAQVGIFRAAGRLAFWDSADSISWANLGDFADFEPSLETLAGNAKFSDIQGRIVIVKSHGEGFILYSTKSIIYIAQALDNAFQWNPTVILSSVGVSYPSQVAEGSPDTVHFAYTSEGLKRIESAREETIVPEVTDTLGESQEPVYLKVLGGRFLFLELLDPKYVTGTIQRSDEVVPAVDYSFPGGTALANVVITEAPSNICEVFAGITNGSFTDTLPAPPPDMKPGTGFTPIWTCYLSNNGVVDTSNIVWDAGNCPTIDPNGVEANMHPGGDTMAKLGSTSANKRAVTGTEAYVTGGWTMERFVAAQSAIWQREDAARSAFIQVVTNRAKTASKMVFGGIDLTGGITRNECGMDTIPTEFTAPEFGFSTCSFWLTRYAVSAMQLTRVKANQTLGVYFGPQLGLWKAAGNNATTAFMYASASEAAAANSYNGLFTATNGGTPPFSLGAARVTSQGIVTSYFLVDSLGVHSQNSFVAAEIVRSSGYENTDTMYAYNKGIDVDIAPTPDSPYCEITDWEYTKTDGTKTTVKAAMLSAVDASSAANTVWAGAIATQAAAQTAYTDAVAGGNQATILSAQAALDSANTALTIANANATAATVAAAAASARVPEACASPAIHPRAGTGGPPGSGMGIKPPINPNTGNMCGQDYKTPLSPYIPTTWPDTSVTIPEGGFYLQKGSPAPVYPTFEGALVYDLQLKKWGKMKLRYKILLDYSPINSTLNGVVPTNVFGINAGILRSDGKIHLFDMYPLSSYISYGKVGYYRLGNTSPEEVRVDFRIPCTGYLRVETSLDGSTLSVGLTKTEVFTDATKVILHGAYPGRWANIEIGGIFDINYLEYRGFIQGRR